MQIALSGLPIYFLFKEVSTLESFALGVWVAALMWVVTAAKQVGALELIIQPEPTEWAAHILSL
jgi:hypothetical protein